ncbi:MAG TPA: ABC transporter permease [Anaerolineales bacterium]|nr:ABC transporter permease [Anaerolineales bacterium]
MPAQATLLSRVRFRLAAIPDAVALASFGAVFLFFALAAENFLTPLSIANILTFASISGIVVVGVAVLMISGEFDLSVGSTFAVASYVFALGLIAEVPPLLCLLAALVVSALLGLLNGLIVTTTGIPSFIATLGTMLAYRGIARAIGGSDFAFYSGEPLLLFRILNAPLDSLNKSFSPAATFRISILWFGLIAVLLAQVLRRTRFGNWVFATGGNRGAALSLGVPVRRVVVANFVLAGLLAGVASVLQFAHRSSVDPLRGEGLELIAVAACVIGGLRLTGGSGSILGACLGMLLLQMLEQGLVLMQIPVQVFQAVAGLILIIAVISNTYLTGEG